MTRQDKDLQSADVTQHDSSVALWLWLMGKTSWGEPNFVTIHAIVVGAFTPKHNVNLMVAREGKYTKSERFILWGTKMFVQKFMVIHPTVVETKVADRQINQYHPMSHDTSSCCITLRKHYIKFNVTLWAICMEKTNKQKSNPRTGSLLLSETCNSLLQVSRSVSPLCCHG